MDVHTAKYDVCCIVIGDDVAYEPCGKGFASGSDGFVTEGSKRLKLRI